MYSSQTLHEKVMHEYERTRIFCRSRAEQSREGLYKQLPEVREIDNEISMLAVKNASLIISDGISPEEAVKALEEKRNELLIKRDAIIKKSGLPYDEPERYCCALCKDTGYVNGKKCSCYDKMLKKVINSLPDSYSDIFPDFEKDVFDNFSLEWYSKQKDEKLGTSPYDNMLSVLRECKLFCIDFDEKGGNLYFYGGSGTGKTFMANCIANFLMQRGKSVLYQSAYKLFQFMEDYKFGKISREKCVSQYDSVYSSDLLIIDDLGTEFTTAYTCSVFFDILNTRLIGGKSTLISTNLSVGKLSQKYTDRVSSRIIGNFELMRFLGDDIRIAGKFSGR